jgi:hypothetical protein
VGWRAICIDGAKHSRARRALEQLTSSLGIIPGFLCEFVAFVEMPRQPLEFCCCIPYLYSY